MADEIIPVAAAYIILKSKKKKERLWIRPYLNRRETLDNLSMEISIDEKLFANFTRMSKTTGDLFKSLMYLFRVSDASISVIIPEVCAALIEVLKEYIKESKEVYLMEEFLDIQLSGKHS
ncbi:hypothetical protein HW555_013918 [Spodoptera exigua]|uniref:Uncharacterized protein n=1 Tax=Spodoptera exigua TaxID=7107 RepID=A0A835G2H3_SPOEX|nr:hypothetical protein HW555_013918 [Spodoptera exigua]